MPHLPGWTNVFVVFAVLVGTREFSDNIVGCWSRVEPWCAHAQLKFSPQTGPAASAGTGHLQRFSRDTNQSKMKLLYFFLVTGAASVAAHRHLVSWVPNGARVPCDTLPSDEQAKYCLDSGYCVAFGHDNCDPHGGRSAFGNQVDHNGWKPACACPGDAICPDTQPLPRPVHALTSTLACRTVCATDSDGDGKTNGDELGDPCCRWVRGESGPDRTSGVSHPALPESVTAYASCAQALAANDTNVTAVEAQSGTSVAHLTLPAATQQCMCALTVEVTAGDGTTSSSVVLPPLSTAAATDVRVSVALSTAVGDAVTVRAIGHNLAGSFDIATLATAVQPVTATTAAPQFLSNVGSTAGTQFVSDAKEFKSTATAAVAAPVALTTIFTIVVVAVFTHLGPSQQWLRRACLNVRGAGPKQRSLGFRLWQLLACAVTVISFFWAWSSFSQMTFLYMARAAFGRSLGVACVSLALGTVVSVTHHLFYVLTGLPFDRSIFGHTWLGLITFFAVLVHAVTMAITAGVDGTAVGPKFAQGAAYALFGWHPHTPVNPLAGTIAWIGLTLLYIPSLKAARKHAYALFYAFHALGFILFAYFSFLHLKNSGTLSPVPFTVVPIVVILVEHALSGGIYGGLASGKVHFSKVLTPTLVRFDVLVPALLSPPLPGQWMQLVLPAASWLPHPLSVAMVRPSFNTSGKCAGYILSFIVRASAPTRERGFRHTTRLCAAGVSWSARVHALAASGTLAGKRVLWSAAPYGKPTFPHSHATRHVLLAGGVGITAMLPLLAELQDAKNGTKLLWVTRDAALAAEALDILRESLQRSGRTRSDSGRHHSVAPASNLAGLVTDSTSPGADTVLPNASSAVTANPKKPNTASAEFATGQGVRVDVYLTAQVAAGASEGEVAASGEAQAALAHALPPLQAAGVWAEVHQGRPDLAALLTSEVETYGTAGRESTLGLYVCGPVPLADAAAAAAASGPQVLLHKEEFGW